MAGFDNDTVYANNVDFSGGFPVVGKITTDGQLLIGSTATPHIRVNTLTAGPGVTITNGSGSITIGLAGGAAAIEKINVQTGTSPITPTGGVITVNGATVAAGTHPVRTDGTASDTFAIEVQISQAIASTDATKIGLCNFNSTFFTVDSNGFVSASGTGILETLTGNSGTATPSSNNINVVTANATVKFVGASSTVTQDFGISNLMLGSSGSAISAASNNASFGNGAMTAITSGTQNAYFGFNAGNASTSASFNNGFGAQTLLALISGSNNVAVGNQTLNGLTLGSNNIVVGTSSGTAYTGSETSNIIIGYNIAGTLGENNVTRIGSGQGSCFISGIEGVSVSNLNIVTINTSTNQLGSMLPGSAFAYTNVNHAASPYTILSTDYYISVDCSGGTVTLNFPNSPTAKQTWIIKDRTGSASTNNISITTPGGTVTFDGLTTYKITSNYGSIELLANSTPTYEVF
jgi:hypothetical protein